MSDKITAIENNNMLTDEQLFTELTPEEGAVIEGGAATVNIYLQTFKPKQNDPVIYVGGKRIAGTWNAKNNRYTFSNLKQKFSVDTTVMLFDQDPGGIQNHDLLMFKNVKESDKGKAWNSQTAHGYKLWTRVI